MWSAFKVCSQLIETSYPFIMFWKKNSSFDLNYFLKENAQVITCSKHFSILMLLNVSEVLEVLPSIGVVFHFNLPDPCAVHV